MNCHDIFEKFREFGLVELFDIDRWEPYGRGVIKLHTRCRSGCLVFYYTDSDTWGLVKTTDEESKLLRKMLQV